jgi:hypothetical protein
MFIIESSGSNSPSTALFLLGGAVGAVIAAVISTGLSMWWTKRLDVANKAWTLKAELRRFHVTRITDATNGLRQCFYKAKTQLEFNLIAAVGFEKEWAVINGVVKPDGTFSEGVNKEVFDGLVSTLQRRQDEAIIRSNERVVLVQAEARAYVSLLTNERLLEQFKDEMESFMNDLAQNHQPTSQGVGERIKVFTDAEPEFLQLLKKCDKVIDAEIARPLR